MKTITIYPPIEVFDDHLYCLEISDNGMGTCENLIPTHDNKPFCTIFTETLDIHVDDQVPLPLKCEQCKKLYQESKNMLWAPMQSNQAPESFLIIAKPTVKDK